MVVGVEGPECGVCGEKQVAGCVSGVDDRWGDRAAVLLTALCHVHHHPPTSNLNPFSPSLPPPRCPPPQESAARDRVALRKLEMKVAELQDSVVGADKHNALKKQVREGVCVCVCVEVGGGVGESTTGQRGGCTINTMH